ncbi:hypothetical protein HYW83_03740 [Candidatus Peregrinibacteria bacterium]|nr:hypothetical protein [Candidatus Peregrinibacteria bacterium]
MTQNKKSRKIIIIGGGVLALVILGITLLSLQFSKAQQSSESASDIVCLVIVFGQPTTEMTFGSCRSGTPPPNFTSAVRCSNANYVISRDSEGYDKCVSSSSVASLKLCSFPKADNSGSTQIYASECPSGGVIPSPSATSNTLICRGGTPENFTEEEASSCSSMMKGTTLAIRCKDPNAYIVRTGQKDSFGYEFDSCSSSISGYVACSYTLAGGSEKITIYQSSCPDGASKTDLEPKPEPQPKDQCPRKPDPVKGTGEPEALPAGTEIKAVPSYYLWGCYSQPDKSANASCTAQAAKRTGNATSPCVYGEESIICPSKGTAYKDGNFLKCAPVKKPAPPSDTSTTTTPPPQPIVITQIIREEVKIEVPSTVSVLPPDVITEDSCADYKKAVDDKILAEGEAILHVADTAFKATDVQNPEFKKVFYKFLKESAKGSRNLKKLSSQTQCSREVIRKIDESARQFEADNLAKVKQSLVFLDKGTKVQNQYIGIQEDFKWADNFSKSLKPDSLQSKAVAEDFKNFNLMRVEFQELVDADKEGKVFGFEIEDLVARIAASRKQIEEKASKSIKSADSSIKKGSAKSKKTVKKAAKKSKKTVKKSSKKKSAKKSTKKTNKKTKSSSAN